MLYSVIMPVYNVEKYLIRSIESILNQTYSDWELILVNDGSTDSSGEICQKYSDKYDSIKVIHQENSGSGIARQKGIEISRGQYIVFVDPDDFIDKNALEKNKKNIISNSPQLIVNGYFQINKENDLKNISEYIPKLKGLYSRKEFINEFESFVEVNPRNLWNKVYEREFLLKKGIKFTNQRVGQDALFNINVYKNLEKLYIDHESYYYYDATRNDSAVRKYNSNRVDYEYNIINSYKEMLIELDVKNRDKIIRIEYWNLITMELINMNRSNVFRNVNKAVDHIESLLQKKELNEIVQSIGYSELNTVFQRIILFLLKNKLYRSLVYLLKLRSNIKKKL